jgi:hypothetical protein
LINVDAAVTEITFNVWDITNQSEIFLDNLVISGGPPVPSVPEPATLAIFSLGLAGMSWVRRRRIA